MTAINKKFGSSKKIQKMMKKNAKKVDKKIFGM
jgi:superoxide dismutase